MNEVCCKTCRKYDECEAPKINPKDPVLFEMACEDFEMEPPVMLNGKIIMTFPEIMRLTMAGLI